MGGTLTITWTNIESMLQSMVDVGLQASDLDDYFQEHVVNTQGLDYPTCALKAIGDQLPHVGTAFSRTRSHYQKRWVEVIEAIARSAAEIDNADHAIDLQFKKYARDLDSMPHVRISVKMFEPKELESLKAPEEGEPRLKHDKTWEATSTGYDATRDGINEAIDVINGLPGVSLPRLPEKSLEEYIVYPLAGNYKLLRANADACSKVDAAFGEWALNFSRLSLQVPYAMEGRTSAQLMAHLNVYALVMKAVGEGIGKGSTAFEGIATMSEKISVAVENALVKMATKLTKLLTKLSSKLSPIGWVWFVAEVAEKGFEAVTDIYHDIMECKDIISACFGLVEEIEAWAQVMSDALKTMREIRDMVEELPVIVADGDMSDLPPVDLPTVEKRLDEITVETKVGDEDEEASLEERLEELEGEAGTEESEESGSDDDEEDGVLMAPGPIGGPPYGATTSTLPMA